MPIQWTLKPLVDQGNFEAAHRELDAWEAADSSNYTRAHALRLRGDLHLMQHGGSPTAGTVLQKSWECAQELSPGDQAMVLNDLLAYAHYAGDFDLGTTGRLAYRRLLEEHGNDPMVNSIKPYICLALGWLARLEGDHTAAMAWFAGAATELQAAEPQDAALTACALSLLAWECIRAGLRAEAATHLATARSTVPAGYNMIGFVNYVQAELATAQGRLFAAENWLEEASKYSGWMDDHVLTPIAYARIHATLGHSEDRDTYLTLAEANLKPYDKAYLRQEIEALRPKSTEGVEDR